MTTSAGRPFHVQPSQQSWSLALDHFRPCRPYLAAGVEVEALQTAGHGAADDGDLLGARSREHIENLVVCRDALLELAPGGADENLVVRGDD